MSCTLGLLRMYQLRGRRKSEREREGKGEGKEEGERSRVTHGM